MRAFIIAALAVGLIGTLGVVLASDASAAPPERSPFIGRWEYVAPDGSLWQLRITGGQGPLHSKAMVEESWFCPSGGPSTVIGKSTYRDATHLDIDVRVRCHIGNDRWEASIFYDYVPGEDVLINMFGNVFHRV